MKKLKKKDYTIIALCVLSLCLTVGLSYAWFSLYMSGKGPEYIVSSGNLKLIYTDTLTIDEESIAPGWSLTKTFTVENTSTKEQYYKIVWKDLINTFVNTSDLTIEVTSTNNGGSLDKTQIPSSSEARDENIIENITIAGKTIQTYTVKFEYAKKETDQTEDMGKILSGTIEIEGLASIGDLSVLAYTCKSCTNTPTSFPTQNDGYRAVSVSCTNGATGEWDAVKWGLLASNITGPTTCTVDFAEGNAFYAQILADNPNVSARNATNHPFSAIMTASNNGNTIYSASGQEGKTTYYFAGSVTNNYVKFGGFYWRIVRINEDGSVRLIYAGNSTTDTSAFINTSTKYSTATNGNPVYAGYKYTANTQHGLNSNSTVKSSVDSWYVNNLLSEYDKYISRTAIYCNDRVVGSGSWTTSTGYPGGFSYAGSTRMNSDPTFICGHVSDQFTASTSVGNNALTYPIALLTTDEVKYAGGLYNKSNTSYYLYQNATTGSNYWWTMTPQSYSVTTDDEGYDIYIYTYVFHIGASSGTGRISSSSVSANAAVRPVISLKSCVQYDKGDGTSANPYEVAVGDECAEREN